MALWHRVSVILHSLLNWFGVKLNHHFQLMQAHGSQAQDTTLTSSVLFILSRAALKRQVLLKINSIGLWCSRWNESKLFLRAGEGIRIRIFFPFSLIRKNAYKNIPQERKNGKSNGLSLISQTQTIKGHKCYTLPINTLNWERWSSEPH